MAVSLNSKTIPQLKPQNKANTAPSPAQDKVMVSLKSQADNISFGHSKSDIQATDEENTVYKPFTSFLKGVFKPLQDLGEQLVKNTGTTAIALVGGYAALRCLPKVFSNVLAIGMAAYGANKIRINLPKALDNHKEAQKTGNEAKDIAANKNWVKVGEGTFDFGLSAIPAFNAAKEMFQNVGAQIQSSRPEQLARLARAEAIEVAINEAKLPVATSKIAQVKPAIIEDLTQGNAALTSLATDDRAILETPSARKALAKVFTQITTPGNNTSTTRVHQQADEIAKYIGATVAKNAEVSVNTEAVASNVVAPPASNGYQKLYGFLKQELSPLNISRQPIDRMDDVTKALVTDAATEIKNATAFLRSREKDLVKTYVDTLDSMPIADAKNAVNPDVKNVLVEMQQNAPKFKPDEVSKFIKGIENPQAYAGENLVDDLAKFITQTNMEVNPEIALAGFLDNLANIEEKSFSSMAESMQGFMKETDMQADDFVSALKLVLPEDLANTLGNAVLKNNFELVKNNVHQIQSAVVNATKDPTATNAIYKAIINHGDDVDDATRALEKILTKLDSVDNIANLSAKGAKTGRTARDVMKIRERTALASVDSLTADEAREKSTQRDAALIALASTAEGAKMLKEKGQELNLSSEQKELLEQIQQETEEL